MQTTHDILMDILARHGVLTPEIVKEEARPDDSPIHAYVFNLPEDEAAEEHYLSRAHRLIQVARVTVRERASDEPRRVRAFLAIPSDDAGYIYEPIASVVSDTEKFRRARLEAVRRLRDAESSLEDLDMFSQGTEFAEVTKEAVTAVRTARTKVAATT